MKNKKNQKGQVLLIMIMALTTIIAVVSSVIFKSTTETQITKLEEDNQKALSAAEAVIDAAIKKDTNTYTFQQLGLDNLTQNGFTGSAVVSKIANATSFVSPTVQKDQIYSFYLDGYNNGFQSSGYYTNQLNIYYDEGSGLSDCNTNGTSLELTLVYGTSPYSIKRLIIDQANKFGNNNDEVPTLYTSNTPVGTTTFHCGGAFTISTYSAQPRLLLVRILGNKTKLGFKTGGCPVGACVFPPQGKFITASAQSAVGVNKQVQLFQSNPQIPAEFFVTSFSKVLPN